MKFLLSSRNKQVSMPVKQCDQIEMLWDACFNHLPTRLDFLNMKLNFLLGMAGIMIALMTLMIALSSMP